MLPAFAEGEHTRTKKVVTSKAGSLFAFTKKAAQCLGCKTVLKDETQAVCPYCKVRLAGLGAHEATIGGLFADVQLAMLEYRR